MPPAVWASLQLSNGDKESFEKAMNARETVVIG